MKSERGNIVVYLLVGLVLFGVLLSGVWWVKNRVANQPTPVATTQEEKPVTGTDTQIDQDKAPETKPEETKPEEAKPAETKPQEQAAPTTPTSPAPETRPNPTPSTTGSASSQTRSTAGSDLAALPPESRMASTGPSPSSVAASGPLENALGTSLGLGIVTFLTSSFVLSRKRAH